MANEAFEAVTRSSSQWRPWSLRCGVHCLRPGYCFSFVFDKDTIIASHWENTKYHPVPRWCPKRNYKRIWRRPPASTTCHYVDAKPAQRNRYQGRFLQSWFGMHFSVYFFFSAASNSICMHFFLPMEFCSLCTCVESERVMQVVEGGLRLFFALLSMFAIILPLEFLTTPHDGPLLPRPWPSSSNELCEG